MTTTSRQPIIDIIELIANLIASASHLQEIIENEEDDCSLLFVGKFKQ